MAEASKSARFKILILFGVILLVSLNESLQNSNLVDHIPGPVTFLSGLAGAGFGFWTGQAFIEAAKNRPIFAKFLAFCFLPGLLFVAGTHTARSAFLAAAFWGAETRVDEVELEVVDRSSGTSRRGFSSTRRIFVQLEPRTREIRVQVTKDLHNKVGPQPEKEEQFIKLRMETGRWGYRRVITPKYFDEPLGLQSYRKP